METRELMDNLCFPVDLWCHFSEQKSVGSRFFCHHYQLADILTKLWFVNLLSLGYWRDGQSGWMQLWGHQETKQDVVGESFPSGFYGHPTNINRKTLVTIYTIGYQKQSRFISLYFKVHSYSIIRLTDQSWVVNFSSF